MSGFFLWSFCVLPESMELNFSSVHKSTSMRQWNGEMNCHMKVETTFSFSACGSVHSKPGVSKPSTTSQCGRFILTWLEHTWVGWNTNQKPHWPFMDPVWDMCSEQLRVKGLPQGPYSGYLAVVARAPQTWWLLVQYLNHIASNFLYYESCATCHY